MHINVYAFLFCDMSTLSEKDFSYDKKKFTVMFIRCYVYLFSRMWIKRKIATYVMMKLNNINFNYIDKSLLFYILQIYILCVRHFKNAYVEK